MNKEDIYLIGPRACGKTTLGQALAHRLDLPFVDTDIYIQDKMGQNISEIVAEKGWDYFRDIEERSFKEISSRGPQVVSTGGGIVLRPANREILKSSKYVFYLHGQVELLARRMRKDNNQELRPALTNLSLEQEIEEVLREREPLYRQCARLVLDASMSVSELIEVCLQTLQH
ncbi:shikimate kinase AroL [Desulfovulcanus sp.]